MAPPVHATLRAEFLPVVGRHAVVPPGDQGDDLLMVACPPGVPVFATIEARVAQVKTDGAGEIVLRSTGSGIRVHYRRLSPLSVLVSQGDLVTPGQLLARVADAQQQRSLGGLLLGVQSEDGRWLDARDFLMGANDPAMIIRTKPADASRPRAAASAATGAAQPHTAPPSTPVESGRTDPAPVVAPAVEDPAEPAPAVAGPPDLDPASDADDPASPPEPLSPRHRLVSRRSRPHR